EGQGTAGDPEQGRALALQAVDGIGPGVVEDGDAGAGVDGDVVRRGGDQVVTPVQGVGPAGVGAAAVPGDRRGGEAVFQPLEARAGRPSRGAAGGVVPGTINSPTAQGESHSHTLFKVGETVR